MPADQSKIAVTLMGAPTCRRYQKMRSMVVEEASRLEIELHIQEISDWEMLKQFSPLSLPRLYVQDELVASQNPPRLQEIARIFEQANKV